MEIARRRRGLNKGKTAVFTEDKLSLNFDLGTLDLMCSYIVSENRNIRSSNIISLRNLFAILDTEVYINDTEKMSRINFITRGLEARLDKGLKLPKLIITYINGGIISDDTIDTENLPVLSNTEIDYIEDTVSGALTWSFIDNDIKKTMEIATRFKAADYRRRDEIMQEYIDHVSYQNSKFRKLKAKKRSDTIFTLENNKMEQVFSDVYDDLTNPNRYLKSAMQGLNQIVAGGFEATRTYLLVGLSGAGKSMAMLNMAYQFKLSNKDYKPKDPTKIPTILFLTQENTLEETVGRLQQIITGEDIRNLSKEEIIDRLRNEGELLLTDSNPINILIMFKPDRSIDTNDLYGIVEDLEDDGYEVISIFQDHIKRIRSAYKQADLRVELGAIVNELKTLAYLKQISIITDTHLNRSAAMKLDSGTTGNKSDLTRLLGRENVGESMLMIDNIDCAIIINREYDADGKCYLVFKCIKLRYGYSERDYICQPFDEDNPIRLTMDINSPVPAFKDTLYGDDNSRIIKVGKTQIKETQYQLHTDISNVGGEENLFESLGTRYSMNGNPYAKNKFGYTNAINIMSGDYDEYEI